MSASKQGIVARTALRLAAWLSVNWTEGTTGPAITLSLLSTLAPLPAAAQTPKVAKVASATAVAYIAADDEQTSPAANAPSPAGADVGMAWANSRDFRFAARLAAVARLNAPLSRAARRRQLAQPTRRAVPIFKAPEIKIVKATRLPTAFASQALTKKVRASADVIDLAVVKNRARSSTARRAA
jgi:hypothetical protein